MVMRYWWGLGVGHVQAHNTKETQPDLGSTSQELTEETAETEIPNEDLGGMDSVDADDPLGLGEQDPNNWDDSEASVHEDENGSDWADD